MNESALYNKSNTLKRGYHNTLWWCLALGALVFAYSCKQANNGGEQNPTTSDDVTITIQGDEGVIVNKLNTIKVKKSLNLTWKDIKQKVVEKITTKENKEIKEWRIKDAKGAVLKNTDIFEKDEIVWCVSKNKEKPPTDPITIIIEVDEGYTFKETTKPCTIEVQKGSAWSSIKAKAEAKIELKDGYEKLIWKLGGKDGGYLEDVYVFNENATVFAVSKRKVVQYKVEHLKENIEDENYTKAEEETKTGEAGKNTSAEAKQYEGFSCQGLAQAIIKADGTTVIQIKYKRNLVSLILDLDGGKTTPALEDGANGKKLLKGKFDAKVEVKGLEKENYGFEKWEPALPEKFPATSHSTIYTAKWTRDSVTITVEGDENVVLGNPNTVSVAKGAKWAEIKAQVMLIASVKENFEIIEWYLNNKDGTVINDEIEFDANTTVFVVSKRKIVKYRVEYYQENIEDNEFTLKETEEKTGEAGKNTLAEAKEYEGFSCQGLAQEVIKADGSTVVQIKYKRNRVSLILDLAGGKTTPALKDGEVGKKLLEGKFGARVEVKGLEKESYGFEKWEPALPEKFPATSHSTIYTAKWKKIIVRIKITGDERVKVTEPRYIDISIASPKTFGDIKAEIEAKVSFAYGWSTVYYCFYDWRIDGEKGEEILDSTQITENITIYARTNYKRFKVSDATLEGYEGEKPRGRIFIPKTIKRIRNKAFKECDGLTAVDLSGCSEITEIGGWKDGVFENCSNLKSIDLSSCSKLLKLGGFSGCSKLKSVNLSGCIELKTICGQSNIGYQQDIGAFSGCTSLESIDLSSCKKLGYIGRYVFKDCSKLKTVNLGGCIELEAIGWRAFEDCTSLESIDLSPCTKLTKIERCAFEDCKEAIVKLPANIINIDFVAFGYDDDSCCQNVLVPNQTIKQLVIDSGYPVYRIEMY